MLRFKLLAIFLCIGIYAIAQTTIVSYDFDDSDQGWTVTSNTNGDWLRGTDIFSAGSNDSYWYTSPSNYNDDAVLVIESPIIDLTGQTDLLFSFRYRHNTEAAWDGFQVEYSSNGGVGWTDLGAVGDGVNWYSDTDVDAIANGADGWSGDNTEWQTGQIELPAVLENNANVMVRIRFESDVNTTDEGVAFDDVIITSGFDIVIDGNGNEISDGDSSPSFEDYTDFRSVDVASGTVIKSFSISNGAGGTLTLTGGTSVTISGTNAADFTVDSQPASTTLDAFETTSFAIEFDPSATGERTATISIASDDPDEDPFTFDIKGIGVNAVIVHDFNSSDNGWTVTSNTNGDWSRGTGTLSSGANGSYWHTTPNGAYNNDAVLTIESPVIDLTGESDLLLYMDIRYDTEDAWDGMKVEYSDDAGANWFDLGVVGDGIGWYNDTDVDAFANGEDGWSGDNSFWSVAQISIPAALEGNANTQFRVLFESDNSVTDVGAAFDNFMIYTGTPDIYLEANGIRIVNGDSSPDALDNTDFRTVDVTSGTRSKVYTITNYDGGTLNFTGGTPVTISGSASADYTVTTQPTSGVAAFESTTFVIQFDPSATGARNATVSIASNDPDDDPFTFDITGTGDNAVINQDFDSGDEGWTVTANTNGDWSRGTGILSTGADGNYWHTTPNGGYSDDAVLTIESGTLDLTGETSLTLFMDVRFDTEVDWDGFQVEYSSDGGANWNDLGSTAEGINWYNDGDVDAFANNANGWTGDNGFWQTAELDLPSALENNSNVQFRVLFASDGSVTETGVAFDNFVIFGDVTPLPVELLAFNGVFKNNQVELTWTTAVEINNDYFEIQHSIDGEEFSSIGHIAGNGNYDGILNYSYIHQGPALGFNFYRLKQVDFDGTETLHEIIQIYNDSVHDGMDVTVYPNPTTSKAMNIRIISGDDHTPLEFKLVNLDGKVILEKEIDGSLLLDQKLMENYNLKPGIYIATFKQGNIISTKRLVIK
ncbi:choice-of-anchor D domain-containing protein [Ekhidna sp. To15]|uniref:choice-of-anchor D domain-containing protein n=1 Tax=Ekhidna sp. To15 TaxID=3395267 RepID=UPI003F5202E0